MRDSIRIMIVDDHSEIHRALSSMSDSTDDLELVAHASNGKEAVEICSEKAIDVIVMDIVMPVMDGIEATKIIHQSYPHIKILALSSFQDGIDIRAMLNAGASGYVLKTASINDLAQTIRTAYQGNSVFSPEVTQALLQNNEPLPVTDYGLSHREFEVLGYLVKGLNNKEIAYQLTISTATVKFHMSSIFAKLGVQGRVEAVALAMEKKLIR